MERGITYINGIIYSGAERNNGKLKTQTCKNNNHSPERDREVKEEKTEVEVFQ
jgi:hypothetical protein